MRSSASASCVLSGLLGALALLAGCTPPWEPSSSQRDDLNGLWTLNAAPRDATNALLGNPDAEALGLALFNDPALSGCGTVSCASCHPAPNYTTATAKGPGCNGQVSVRNPPTLLNVAFSEWFNWDGRADRLWSHAVLPLLNPVEMASTPAILRARLQEAYAQPWASLFGAPPETFVDDDRLLANFGKVLAAYESTLLTGESPFDADLRRFVSRWDEGEGLVQSDPAYLGLFVFVEKGKCISCHKGPTLSDDLFHNVGVGDEGEGRHGREGSVEALLASPLRADGVYSDNRSTLVPRLANLRRDFTAAQADPARLDLEFRGAFKTPTLRNIAETGPYMHTGAYGTLEEVVDLYNRGGEAKRTYLGAVNPLTIHALDLTREEEAALVELLRSMSAPRR